jgi:phosphinothricin acetyltransferase
VSRAGAVPVVIRAAAAADLPAIAELYAHHVLTGTASFEVAPPTVGEMRRRHRDVVSHGLPYFVASLPDNGTDIAGYAYATAYRSRVAYRHTVEDSVYVAPGCVRRGAGRALLAAVIAACETLGYRQMVAVISSSDNAASISLHSALSFGTPGCCRRSGTSSIAGSTPVLMQRALGPGASTPAP